MYDNQKDARGKFATLTRSNRNVCLFDEVNDIELLQHPETKLFTVRYGMQSLNNADYAAAALELGSCLMHALACEGLLINS